MLNIYKKQNQPEGRFCRNIVKNNLLLNLGYKTKITHQRKCVIVCGDSPLSNDAQYIQCYNQLKHYILCFALFKVIQSIFIRLSIEFKNAL